MRFTKEVIISFLTFSFLLFLLAFYHFNHKPKVHIIDNANLQPSVFNFSQVDLSEKTILGLVGNVEFYWEQLLTPEDFTDSIFKEPSGVFMIPGVWNKYKVKGEPIGDFGYATYKFSIIAPKDDVYALKIKEFECAYNVWINGELHKEVGRVGKTAEAMTPSWKRSEIIFQTQNDIAEIIIQVSNFQHRKGGAEDLILFGRAEDILRAKRTLAGLEVFLLGVLFMMSAYHLVIYFFRRKDKTIVFFSLLCFLMAMRLLTTGEELISEIFPSMGWYLSIRIEYLSYTLAVPVLVAFLYYFYKKEFSLLAVKVIGGIAILFSLIILLTPPIIFSYTPIVYQGIIGVISIYILYGITKALLLKRENAIIFFGSYFMFFFIVVNDILYYNKVFTSGFLMPFGVFILTFVQATALSKSFSTAFNKVDLLREELEVSNLDLADRISNRTRLIQQQKDEIEDQAKHLQKANDQMVEMNTFKESLTAMIIHDLKNPLNIILNFSKDERVVFAGHQMLNRVHNLLDVQRHEDKGMKLHLEKSCLNQHITNAVDQLSFLIKDNNISLETFFDGDYQVSVDTDIINRVFVNLLSNALKFSPPTGFVKINTKKDGNNVIVQVIDSGPGIPDNQKDKIFEKFGQHIIRRSGQSGSTGLGLTFCKLAMEAHGGDIDFVSDLGKGTTFFCTLPVIAVTNQNSNSMYLSGVNIDNVNFTAGEIDEITGIVNSIEHMKIYEISRLRSVLSKVQSNGSRNVELWLEELKKATAQSDIKMFDKLKSKAD